MFVCLALSACVSGGDALERAWGQSLGEIPAEDGSAWGIYAPSEAQVASNVALVDPSTKKVVVVKSMQHFHAAYAPIASEVVYVAAPGALVPDWSLLPYTKVDKGQWPFVADPHAA